MPIADRLSEERTHQSVPRDMLQRFWSHLVDETMGVMLLHAFLRYRRHPPVAGIANGFADLHSGALDTFYQPVPHPVDLDGRLCTPRSRAVRDFCFPSSVSSSFAANDQVWCRHWNSRHGDAGLTVVGVDGIVQVGARWFDRLAAHLSEAGIDTVMMDAPFNYRRTPRGYRPGQLIVGGDFNHQMLVARQAVLDLWTVIKSLQHRGRRVGLVGVSYGGWMALMASLLAENLEFVIALAPPVDLLQLLSEGGPVVRAIRRGWGFAPLDLDRIHRATRAVIPSAWRPNVDAARITLHAARYDRFVPYRRIVQLSEQWGTRLVVHNGSHCRVTIARDMTRRIAADIRALESTLE